MATPEEFGVTYEDLSALTSANNLLLYNPDGHEKKSHLISISRICAKVEGYAIYVAVSNELSDCLTYQQALHVLSYYWAWFHPNVMHIYRPLFFRHMLDYEVHKNQSYGSGVCYSPALLTMILASGARAVYGLDSPVYKQLDDKAYSLLMEDLRHSTNCLATVGACMELALRSVDLDHNALAWNFSGLAFRTAHDLNLFNRPQMDSSAEEHEAKTAIKYSLRAFDILVSLYTSRPPTTRLAQEPHVMLDDDSFDLVQWVDPVAATSTDETKTEDEDFMVTSRPIYLTETFKWQMRVTTMQNRIIHRLHDNSKRDELEFFKELSELWSMLPGIFKVSSKKFNAVPHIFTLNMSYHLCYLLLLVPMFHQMPALSLSENYVQIAVNTADQVKQCLEAYASIYKTDLRNFTLTYTTYLYYQLIQSLSEIEHIQQKVSLHIEFAINVFKTSLLSSAGGNAALTFVKSNQLHTMPYNPVNLTTPPEFQTSYMLPYQPPQQQPPQQWHPPPPPPPPPPHQQQQQQQPTQHPPYWQDSYLM
ncbi:hypothetical protein TRICI_000950 [Trichomonascus ciferrii]|uniref:Xylanolytic transcriptional activator regulatory domain-containing protein n=1 Tax=Trichomonascus ciferrii TaxID=44093 RepID=A0A642VAH6_9ASCO|nr:hypothetical protein TRICI_000950 [Trichomonascus ciferrii]